LAHRITTAGLPSESRRECRKALPVADSSEMSEGLRRCGLTRERHARYFVSLLMVASTSNLRSRRNW
jgi:hypothetical protein